MAAITYKNASCIYEGSDKLAVDNLWDWYHPAISHASATMSGYFFRRPRKEGEAQAAGPTPQQRAAALNAPRVHNVLVGEYGHAISGPAARPDDLAKAPPLGDPRNNEWRDRPEAGRRAGAHDLGEIRAGVAGSR